MCSRAWWYSTRPIQALDRAGGGPAGGGSERRSPKAAWWLRTVPATLVLEELTGEKIPPYQYSIGMVARRATDDECQGRPRRARFFVGGQLVQADSRDFLKTLERGDVVIKGGNAVD